MPKGELSLLGVGTQGGQVGFHGATLSPTLEEAAEPQREAQAGWKGACRTLTAGICAAPLRCGCRASSG